VCPVADLRGEARAHAERLPPSIPLEVCGELPANALTRGTVVVDALLGTGISGALRAPYDRIIGQINRSGCAVVSVDVPSGLNAADGEVATDAVTADLTLTMAFPKPGLLTGQGTACCGVLRCMDIGVPAALKDKAPAVGEAVFLEDVAPLLGRRKQDGHKGLFGHVLVLGGSKLYGGAPVLAAESALRVGCGLATVAVPEHTVMACSVPAALIVRRLDDAGSGFLCDKARIAPLTEAADVVVFGPGLGPAPDADRILKSLLDGALPVVVDADGLRLLASLPDVLPCASPAVILTPHPGEMRILLDGFGIGHMTSAGRTAQASALAERTGAYVVLKGTASVLAAPDGRCALNTSGTVALATAGTGDVLAGILGGLVAGGMKPWDALRAGVFLHGYCAEICPTNGRALIADDVVKHVSLALSEITPFE